MCLVLIMLSLLAACNDEDAAKSEATTDAANDAPIMASAHKEKSANPEFKPQVDAVCALHMDNWLLIEIEKDSQQEKESIYDPDFSCENEIIESVTRLVLSPEFEKIKKEVQEDSAGDEIIEGLVEKGETLASILEKSSRGSVAQYVSAARKVFSLKAFREGQPYRVRIDPETGRLQSFEYEINGQRKLVVEGEEKPEARMEEINYVTLLEIAEGEIDDSLFKAVADIGESPELAMRLVKLFGAEINFSRNIKPGDAFSVLIEKRYRNGEYKGYGRIVAAIFTNRGQKFEAFLFRDGEGRETYYNAEGKNLNKTLLQSPLAITRLTSRYSHNRFHPILGIARPHLGVDYGAPTGTPVKAVGDGVISEKGWAGGYGNQLVIRHRGGVESLYSHLSGFAKGLHVGEKVEQGQVIGFVGSTGLSTGPHLDFRLRQKGEFIDPLKVINPRGAPVASVNKEAFNKTRDLARACLSGEMKFENYKVDSIVPLTVVSVEDEIIQIEEDPEVVAARAKAARRQYLRRQANLKRLRQIDKQFSRKRRWDK